MHDKTFFSSRVYKSLKLLMQPEISFTLLCSSSLLERNASKWCRKVKKDGKRADQEARCLVHQVEYMMKCQPSLAESAKSVEKRERGTEKGRELKGEGESRVG